METRTILKNKVYLYMTEFFAGMSVMAVELGASRLLAHFYLPLLRSRQLEHPLHS